MEHLINEAYAIAVKIASVERDLPILVAHGKTPLEGAEIAHAAHAYIEDLYIRLKAITEKVLAA